MKEKTYISNREGKDLKYYYHIPIKKAVTLARDNGLTGRLEIEHSISEGNEMLYSMYAINEENQIVCAIFPYRKPASFN